MRFIQNQVGNMITRSVREVKVDGMSRLADRSDADAWGIAEHGISFQN